MTTNTLKLFGLDLRSFANSVIRPWQSAYRWSLFAWLSPQVTVRLHTDNGQSSLWTGAFDLTPSTNTDSGPARFTAVALPEDSVLRKRLTVPALSEAEIGLAVALEAKRISPFPQDDLAYGYVRHGAREGMAEVDIALASRKLVQQVLARSAVASETSQPEIWVPTGISTPIIVGGYGEDRRAKFVARYRRIGYLLLTTALCLVAALAITPTLQLRLRTIDAVQNYTRLTTELAPVVNQREAYLKATNSLNVVKGILGSRVDPAGLIELVTQALPDDTALLSLQAEGRKITISGQTNNTAEMMQKLSAVPGILDVRAPIAATRPLGVTKETFTVEFTMADPAAAKPGATASTPRAAS